MAAPLIDAHYEAAKHVPMLYNHNLSDMDFQVVVDASLVSLGIGNDINPNHNKWLLSLVNDFEDGKWRKDIFDNFIWDNIADTALSHREREALIGLPHSLLVAAAKNLRFTSSDQDISRGSELAEIVLYGIMRHKYGALPVVPKIFYKQNSQDNAKGADSVHIVVAQDESFTLWFGEAKFYNSVEDARLNSIVTSVKNSLSTSKLRKENSIIVNLADIDNLSISQQTKTQIKSALANKTSIDNIKPLINVPILILHECEITAATSEMSQSYTRDIETLHRDRAVAYFTKQVSTLQDIYRYGDVTFHLILFPVPEKEPLVDQFVKNVSHYKG